ncbi:MAG: 3'-5' exonuclease, partial [Pseudomonadota bacterium]
SDELTGRARASFTQLIRNFDRWRDAAATMTPDQLAATVLEECGYTDMLQADKSPDAAGRLDNLSEFVRSVGEFETLGGFLEHVSLVMDTDSAPDTPKVSLMTLHGAKGLEFDHVFLPGWEDGLFPSQRSLDESGLSGLEEERRLAYVGLTRARQAATILFAGSRMMYGQWQSSIPSRFIDELDGTVIERDVQPGLYGGWGQTEANEDLFSAPVYGQSRGPGWHRARERAAGGGPGSSKPPRDGAAQRLMAAGSLTTDLTDGERVFHDKFGYGTIAAIDGNKVEVEFEKAGRKRVVATFLKRDSTL